MGAAAAFAVGGSGCIFNYPDPACGAAHVVALTALAPDDWYVDSWTARAEASERPWQWHVCLIADGITVADTVIVHHGSQLDCDIKADASTGALQALVWTDYAGAYSLDDGHQARLQDGLRPQMAAEKEAWCGMALIGPGGGTVQLEHALAAVRIVATDAREFDGVGRELEVTVVYPDPVPSVFDAGSSMAVYAEPSAGVVRTFTVTSAAGDVVLGGDLVMVNEAEQMVRMAVHIAEQGTLIASSPVMEVPVRRGHVTEVRGEFLTMMAGAGVSISPTFDGDFNYEISFD